MHITRGTAIEDDAPALHADRISASTRDNLTTILDHRGSELSGRSCREDDKTAFGDDGVLVFDLCIKVLLCDCDALQLVASAKI